MDELSRILPIATGAVTVVGVVITFLTAALDQLKWKRNFALEERKWVEKLNHEMEMRHFDMRTRHYPAVITAIKELSVIDKDRLDAQVIAGTGRKLHEISYSEAVLCMRGDTRKALSNLRDSCLLFPVGKTTMEDVMKAKTFFLTTIFRDMGLVGDWNPDVPSLIELMEKNLTRMKKG